MIKFMKTDRLDISKPLCYRMPNKRKTMSKFTDEDRQQWYYKDEGLRILWQESKLTKQEFVDKYRESIDTVMSHMFKEKPVKRRSK